MNKPVLTFFSFFIAFLAFQSALQAQISASGVQNRMNTWMKATNEADWNTIMDMTYDKIFEQVPKEQMLGMFEQMKAMGMEVSLNKFELKEMGDPIQDGGNTFLILTIASIENIELTGTQFQTEQVVNMMKQQFNTTYGEENVEYTKESNSFKLIGTKTLVAVAPDGSSAWKFMEYNKGNPMQMQMAKNLLPENVLKAVEE